MRSLFGLVVIAACCAPLARATELAVLRNGFNIRTEHHQQVGDVMRLYLTETADDGYVDVPNSEIASFEPAPPEPKTPGTAAAGSQPNLKAIVNSAGERHQIDADFITSVIRAESANNPRAVSPKGAQGLMQLMPDTAKQLGVSDSFDPEANVDGGVRYLRELLVKYHGDAVKALAAYNAGEKRVQQYKGVPPYRETRAYIAGIINDYNRKKLAQSKTQTAVQRAAAKPNTTSQRKLVADASHRTQAGQSINQASPAR